MRVENAAKVEVHSTPKIGKGFGFVEVATDIVARCLESGDPPSELVRGETIAMLSPSGLREAARVGLVREAGDILHKRRAQAPPEAPTVRTGRVVNHDHVAKDKDSLEISLVGVEGTLKTLLEFTAADCGFLFLDARGKKDAWRDREKWASRAQQLITQSHSAREVQELPKAQVAELRQLAKVAWS